jgi:mRNA-degrading endonuclease RelE of RelBE toxin-antitoxin system
MSKKRRQAANLLRASSNAQRGEAGAFGLRYTEDAGKEIRAPDGSIKKQLQRLLLNKLAKNPEGYGLPLRGPLTGYWKHEFADHRVVYRIYPDPPTVVVCAVGPRKEGDTQDVYNRLNAVAKTGRLAGQLAAVLEMLLPKK